MIGLIYKKENFEIESLKSLLVHVLSVFLILGLNMSLNAAKTNDVPIMKNLKAPPSCVKLAFGAMCVVIGVAPEKIPEAQAKKNVTMKCHLVAITNAPYK